MVVYLSFHTVYFSNNLYCFLKLFFSLFTCTDDSEVDLYLVVAAVTLFWNWNYNCHIQHNPINNWYCMSCMAELVLWARAMQTCLKTSEQQNVDWRTLHELVNSGHLNLAWTDICTALGGRKTWSAGCMNEDILWGGKLCLVNKLCFIYTACLYIVFFAL